MRVKLYALIAAGCVGMHVCSYAQLSVKQGAAITGTNAFIVLNDLSLEHNATPATINHTFKFTGGSTVVIKGTTAPSFNKLLMNKTAGTKLILQQNINVSESVDFNGGLIDLNGKTLALAATALLLNEKEDSRVTGANGGLVTITVTLNAPSNSNPGNLGAVISSGANMGQTIIKRGHQSQTGTGLPGTILRFYDIQPSNNTNLNATLRLRYLDAELNSWAEGTLALLTSTDNNKWNVFSATTKNTSQNFLDRTGVNSFARMTLGADKDDVLLPVTDLQLTVSRINEEQVLLSWSTATEVNNKGFYVERRLADQTSFTTVGFVASKGSNGNSNLKLQYQHTDASSYSGLSYYRLRQVDIDNWSSYSPTRVVSGSQQPFSIKTWPNPANGFFFVQATTGNASVTSLELYDAGGRLFLRKELKNGVAEKISGLPAGTYLIRAANVNGIQTGKVIVH